MEDHFYHKANESLNSSATNNSKFKFKRANELQDFYNGEVHERDKNVDFL